MTIRMATADDADAIAAIYAPVVRHTTISFEVEPPTPREMAVRIAQTLRTHPWLVSLDEEAAVDGYAYGSRHRERAAYQWSVDVTVYVREDRRGHGVGRALYAALLRLLAARGFCQAFAGIALPNPASVKLHEAMGFQPLGVYRKVGYKLGRWCDVGWWQLELNAGPPPSSVAT